MIKLARFIECFSDVSQIDGKTIRSSENGSKTSVIINVGSQPFDLAYDVIGKLLFWTCAHTNSINITRWATLTKLIFNVSKQTKASLKLKLYN